MRAALITAGALAACACAGSLSPSASRLRTGTDAQLQHCDVAGEFEGSSLQGGLAASAGEQSARNEAQEAAAEAGATHIVWLESSGGWSGSAKLRAYRCDTSSR